MRSPLRTWLLSLLLIAAPASAQVYRCEVPGKPPTYQDKPCAGRSGGPVALPPLSVVPALPETAPATRSPDTAAPAAKPSSTSAAVPPAPTPAEVRSAIMGNRVLPGMKAEEVLAAAGNHTDHNTEQGLDADGRYELWVFSRRMESFPFVVKLRNGVVVETRER
ncbi:MAG TPA: hypothetical protein VGE22_07265 [Solimonas sp.]